MGVTSIQNSSVKSNANKKALVLAGGALALKAANYNNCKTFYNSDVFSKGASLKNRFQSLKNLFHCGEYNVLKSGARLMNPIKFSKGRLISTIALGVVSTGMAIGAVVNLIKANKAEDKQN